MATRFKNDQHLRQHVLLAMQQVTTNDKNNRRYDVSRVHHLLKEQGYLVAFDKVAGIVWAVQREERDADVICFWCGNSVSPRNADLVGVDAGTGKDMYWCGCEQE